MTTNRDANHGSIRPRRTMSYRIARLGARWTMRIALAAFVAQLSLACGSDDSAKAPPPFPSEEPSRTPAADSEETPKETQSGELDPVIVPPAETSTVFAGTLAATATVPFGGSGFCKYDVTLKDVAIEIEILPNGDVGRATVRDLVVERALDGCPYGPMDPSVQDFTLKTHAVTTTGTRVELAGSKTNRPETALVVDLVETAAGYDATATWKRTDQKAPLAWSVTARAKLAKK
jgi:hypothetical protein